MTLGRLLRQLGISTMVGHTDMLGAGADGVMRAQLSPSAFCASMCPFVVLGGARRHVPAQARVLVHQIWPRLRREDAMASTYSAQDFVALQRELGLRARYVSEMGGDIELFEISLRIPPWEVMRPLSQEDLRRMKLSNSEDVFTPVLTGAAPATANVVDVPLNRTFNTPDRGWTINEGTRGMSRKHPLTIEGEPIGSFELSFTCDAQGITANYVEQRMVRGNAQDDRVASIIIVSGKDFGLRMPVRTSSLEGRDALRSVATARVPAGFIEALVASEGRSLTIGTQTMRRTRTAIRPGNTGFAESFKRSLTDCAKQ